MMPLATSDSGPFRRAVAVADRQGSALAAALRRSIPFLTRRGVGVVAESARAVTMPQLLAELPAPWYVAQLVTDPGGQRAALALAGPAVAYLLEGMLGGDGAQPPELPAEGLSGPQQALLSRVADSILHGLSNALGSGLGLRLARLPDHAGGAPIDSPMVALPLAIGEPEAGRRVLVAIAKDALLASNAATATASRKEAVDARVAATLSDVQLELCAELGRVRMTLGELTSLKVGDTLRLSVPVEGIVQVRANGLPLLDGKPTTAGSQLAIKIVARHDA